MRNIWVISDTHFNHENIIKYCDRPFSCVIDMNETMIQNWNAVVKDGDIVYHLGDVYMGDGANWFQNIAPRLKGRKRLVLGNHDNGKDQTLQKVFQKISVWRMFPEYKLLLTHVPVASQVFNAKIEKNVHGHTHVRNKYSDEYVNVCVEQINYTPVNIEELKVR